MATSAKFPLLTFWIVLLLAVPALCLASPTTVALPKPAIKADVPVSMTNFVKNPGLENGAQDWTTSDSRGQEVIRLATPAHSGSNVMALGGVDSDTSYAYQDVAIPADASQVALQFWYSIVTQELAGETRPFDKMTVALSDPVSNAVLTEIATFSNGNRTNGVWARSTVFDVSGYKGRTVRLTFSSVTDGYRPTSFFIDDIQLGPAVTGPPATTAPLTAFRAAPIGGVPLTVQFTDQSELAASWLWNFGDGATSTEQNPVHSYRARGTYTVTLITTNSAGSSSVSRSVKDYPDISSIIMMFNE